MSATTRLQAEFKRLPLAGLLWLSLGLICAALVAATAWEGWTSHRAALARASSTSGNLAQVLSQHTEQTFDTVHLLLDVLSREVGPDPADAGRRSQAAATLAALTQDTPYVATLRVLDGETGRPLFAFLRSPADGADLDRQAAASHAGKSDPHLRIGTPVRDPLSGAWLVGVSKRIGGRDGIPGNVAVAHVSLDSVLKLFDSVALGPDSTIALSTIHGIVLARRPGQVTFAGQSIASSILFREKLAAAPTGEYETVAASDGVRRLFSYRKLDGLPAVLSVGLSEAEVLAPWRAELERNILFTLAAVAGLLGLGLLLSREVRRRDRVEQALLASERRLRLALKAARMWEWELDLSTRQITRSEASTDVLGIGPGPIRDYVARIHPDDRPLVEQALRDALTGQIPHLQFRFVRPDGETLWLELRGDHHPEEGAAGRLIGVSFDITPMKQAERALQDSEALYRLVAESTGDMIVRAALGPAGARLYLSPATREVLGYAPEELLGSAPAPLLHPDDVERWREKIEALSRGEIDRATNIHRLRHKAGHWVTVEASYRLVRDPAGEPLELVSVVRDITERQTLEAQLAQSQKMEAVGQLTGGIAHDFNNLLTIIVGNAELLAEDASDPDQRQALSRMILEAGERGADLTQKLLAFGRRQSLKPESLDLADAVRGMTPLLQRTLGEHIELRTELPDRARRVLTDRALLESAILNLAVNARDAMPQGGTLTITAGERPAGPAEGALPEGRALAYVTVSDTGTGMPPEVAERAFEPFFTTKEVGKGSGLGLSMVYGFAQQSGGHVAIESRPGQGTAVTILLPAARDQAPASAAPRAQPAALGRHAAVLVVEDEIDVQRYATSTLAAAGCTVTAVAAGQDALDLLEREGPFDLLFTDVVLPRGMSGIELARRAREIRPSLRVLLTSGYPEDVFAAHGPLEDGIPLLRKPYRRADLAAALRAVFADPGEAPACGPEQAPRRPETGGREDPGEARASGLERQISP
ncbi:MAG TPA: PAS domain S-box protein [Microvirga sp.]|jgi:PAS domain S-box-containing protein|nr:PAS domain S-box protein [Microvirga sp.]